MILPYGEYLNVISVTGLNSILMLYFQYADILFRRARRLR